MRSQKFYVVTGGAGFIGSHVVEALIERGDRVRVIDNLSTGVRAYVHPDAEFFEASLADPDLVSGLMSGADGIFHLAALPQIQPSFEQPIVHDDANVRATLVVLEAMKRANVRSIVYSSSASVYGDASEVPTPETAAVSPLSPYALQKYASEQYTLILGRRMGMRSVVLRYFNVYGPRSFNPKNPFNAYSSVIGIYARAVREGRRLQVTGTGEQTRDFVHVLDVARANLLAMDSSDAHGIFNVGGGKAISVNAVAALFADSWDRVPERAGEIQKSQSDSKKISSVLGWRPLVQLEDAIRMGRL